MSLLAENNGVACALRQSVKNTINTHFKRHETRECLAVSSHVPTLKHEAKQGYITWEQLFVCFMKQLKEFWVIHT